MSNEQWTKKDTKRYDSAIFVSWPDVRTVDDKDTRGIRLWRSIAVMVFREMASTPKYSETIVLAQFGISTRHHELRGRSPFIFKTLE